LRAQPISTYLRDSLRHEEQRRGMVGRRPVRRKPQRASRLRRTSRAC